VDFDDPATADRLGRISNLLAGLPGPFGNGEMLVWVEHGDRDSMPQAVFDHLRQAGLLERWYPQIPVNVPETAAELMTRLDEVDEQTAAARFTSMTTRTLAYRTRGRCDEANAREMFAALRRLFGHDTIWWAKGDQTGWNPVTRHTIDAIVIGVGAATIVTLLAYDED
jgi:hypothetical protein